jgi:hypothetical protein
MEENLFRHLDIPAASIHIPDGLTKDPTKNCADYEAAIRDAGGIDHSQVQHPKIDSSQDQQTFPILGNCVAINCPGSGL